LGVAALHIEDQLFPKRCGHLDDKSLISSDEMCRKISIARESLKDEQLLIIGRTDAIAVEGFDRAIERANNYAKQHIGLDALRIEDARRQSQDGVKVAEIHEPGAQAPADLDQPWRRILKQHCSLPTWKTGVANALCL
jgi:2-methylisocitrate lyase-like PEP mutase family enzyme